MKHYETFGPLFFGSVRAFTEKFDIADDPVEVIIDFAESRVVDIGGIEALNRITERYREAGKKLHLRHLSADRRALLKNAEDVIDVNIMEDPSYREVLDRIQATAGCRAADLAARRMADRGPFLHRHANVPPHCHHLLPKPRSRSTCVAERFMLRRGNCCNERRG